MSAGWSGASGSGNAVPSQEELDAFTRDWHAIQAQGKAVAEAAERKREMLLADLARETTGVFGGIPLPEDVRSVAGQVARVASFMPFVPDAEKPAWADRLAELVGLLARALGV